MPRRYGQHFLKDPAVAARIAEASGVGPDDTVLEIGPGRGILTRALAARAKKVLTVEIDRHLHARLVDEGLPANVVLRLGDALALDDASLASELGPRWSLVSNLPYEITSATLQSFLTRTTKPSSITLMLQKEVGERIVAKDGKQNRLALFCGYHADRVSVLFNVPRGAFDPPPAVESCVIRLDLRSEPRLPPAQEACYFRLIEAAFASPRRTVGNTLAKIAGIGLKEAAAASGVDLGLRPEKIPMARWISLASELC